MMSFDEEVAEVYDEMDRREDTMDTVAFLEPLAGGGTALELAIGTGRVALPLAARGIRVDGIDLSPAMVAKLRAKPGGDQLTVTMGDFAEVPVQGTYRLIYLVYNTLFNLLTQDDQVRCFENVATHLTDDGVFVIEAYVPYVTRLRGNQHVDAEAIEADQVTLDVGRLDPVKQMYYESHVVLSHKGVRLFPIVQRYAWPSELDLMARIAGLRLKERWGGWHREPFIPTSTSHVSVYGR
ncbi:MAG: class I SAM-dependent methyltransferase [Ktedonobacterales bacterium]|nr:class I SAM-dependent methyltransferase [Ktedonobacterales bacterium]